MDAVKLSERKYVFEKSTHPTTPLGPEVFTSYPPQAYPEEVAELFKMETPYATFAVVVPLRLIQPSQPSDREVPVQVLFVSVRSEEVAIPAQNLAHPTILYPLEFGIIVASC